MRHRVLVAAVILSLVLVSACRPAEPKPPPPPPPPPPPTTTTLPPPPDFSGVKIKLTQIVSLPGAITMAVRPPATADPALYVATQSGVVHRVESGTTAVALNISARVLNSGEQGFLGMTFSPDGTKLYVHFSQQTDGATAVEEFAFDGVTRTATAASARRLLTVPTLEANHNGGSLLFGPDGMLYLALGDGGGGNDNSAAHLPGGNGQALDSATSPEKALLGKILRIDPTDPDGAGALTYTIPPTNPFANSGGRPEIWSYGLRNPFRMSFDRTTGDLWVGDVGQSAREEIDWVAATDATHPRGKGTNFGWNRREGDLIGPNADQSTGPYTNPVRAIDRSQGDRAIVGGYVYRGSAIPELSGAYLFADFYHFAIRAMRINGSGTVVEFRDFGAGVGADGTASFGEDNAGELYVVSLYTGVYRIDKVP